jgi:Raf kinase inhibitor-like YbhB/YbcL family protein
MARRVLLVICFLFATASSFAEEPKPAEVTVEPSAQQPAQLDQAEVPGVPTPVKAMPFRLTSTAFEDGKPIPEKYTCQGADISPPLLIQNTPAGTKSMALTVHDPEGVVGTWVHWVVFAIPPEAVAVPEKFPLGVQALNDFGNFYYNGPCLQDQKPHKFIFTVYALNSELPDETEGATMDSLLKDIQGKIIARAELVGTYQNMKAE